MYISRYKNKEYIYIYDCISGNGQRNYAVTKFTNPKTLLYYFNDDNIYHPNLCKLLDNIDNDKINAFNPCNRIKANNKKIGYIDTAMVIIPFNLCKNIKWN